MKFRRAKEMKPYEKRTPISIRVRENVKKALVAEAKTNGLTLALLVETVLEDYYEFLKKGSR